MGKVFLNIKKVVCAISGGVDSSVAALLLKKKGYEVLGVFMKNWDNFDEVGYCTTYKDEEDAEFACKKIGIPFQEVNFVKQYWIEVFSSLLIDYKNGITPNPDILCNKLIKFGVFYNHAINHLGADAIATGHYARNSFGDYLEYYSPNKGASLLMSADNHKDQTFFLSQISQESLQRCIFPLSNITKNVVKKIAMDAGLEKIVHKKESTGICFIGRRKFSKFIEEYIEPSPGNFIDIETDKIIGRHLGIHFWTVGQRCLLGGKKAAFFVVEINPKTQDIFVAPGTNHPALYCQKVLTGPPHWINHIPQQYEQNQAMKCYFRFQHGDPLVTCTITSEKNGHMIVELDEPLRALTPGQYAVFYIGEECLGSARIICLGPSLYAINQMNYQKEI